MEALPSAEEVRRLRTHDRGLTDASPGCWARRDRRLRSGKLGITPVMTRYFRVLPPPKVALARGSLPKGQSRDTGEEQSADKFVK